MVVAEMQRSDTFGQLEPLYEIRMIGMSSLVNVVRILLTIGNL